MGVKIGNIDVSYFKVGVSDCSIYLGDTKLYPQSQPHDYSQDYFTIVSEEDNNTISLKNTGYSTSTSSTAYWQSVVISASTDGGSTWSKFTTSRNETATFGTINKGDKILLKSASSKFSNTNSAYHYFDSTKNISAEGNILSLIYGNNFLSYDSLPSISTKEKNRTQQLGCIFKNSTKIISAENLVLKPTTLSPKCYANMFYGCTNLTTAPSVLLATTLADYCYQGMFDGCTSLTAAPTSIGTSSTTLADHCCYIMFQGCTSLTTAPELPATTLATNCYSNMFQDCTSLTSAPILPATTLASSCYASMFGNCTSLATAPELPTTTLASSCYSFMFQGCTSLTTAPILPATTLANFCYQYMFQGCTSLSSITCFATDISAATCTTDWVNGVAASGTFTKPSSMNDWSTGVDGIPSGWTVQDYVEPTLVESGDSLANLSATTMRVSTAVTLSETHSVTFGDISSNTYTLLYENGNWYNWRLITDGSYTPSSKTLLTAIDGYYTINFGSEYPCLGADGNEYGQGSIMYAPFDFEIIS